MAEAFEQVLKDFEILKKMWNIILMDRNRTAYYVQILSITCNNVSNNNTMVEALGDWNNLPPFEGQASCTCCFTHRVNLIAKSLLRQFDSLKSKSNNNNSPNDDLEHMLNNVRLANLSGKRKLCLCLQELLYMQGELPPTLKGSDRICSICGYNREK